MAELVEISRQVAALRTPLSQHPRLTSRLAELLYVWVGQAMRRSLTERFRLDSAALDQALAQAVVEVHAGAADRSTIILTRHGEREIMERRLIEKLHGAG